VYLRGNIWWMKYYVRGVPVQESTGFTEKKDAENLLKQRIGEAAAGRRVGPEKTTISDLCALVVDDHRLRKLRDVRHVEWRISAHIQPLLGGVLAARFGPVQVRRYIEFRRSAGASDSTINRELSIVRRGFSLGMEQDPPVVHQQPVIRKLEEDNVRQGFLEPEQYERLLAEVPERLKAMLVCGYHTGARKNELRKITWEQVDLESGLIRLTSAQTKGKRDRLLPIYGVMARWLEHQRETCPPGSPFVFHGARMRPTDEHLDGWPEACVRAGLRGLMFHDLRRSAVRNMKRAGVQDLVAMRISGHRTRAVFDRYNIVDEMDVRGAAHELEAFSQRRKAERAAKLRQVK
jgi:integrase